MTALITNLQLHPSSSDHMVGHFQKLPHIPKPTLLAQAGSQETATTTPCMRGGVPFPMPKKLGSDRLLLVSNALHETPTYKSISPTLQQQRKSLRQRKKSFDDAYKERQVHFRCVDQIQDYQVDQDAPYYNTEAEESHHHRDLFFKDDEFAYIFARDDQDYSVAFRDMDHTRRVLQLWGMCSPGRADDECDDIPGAVLALQKEAPIPNARGLEQRIITGIRNHRQKAVQSFLHQYKEQRQTQEAFINKMDCSVHIASTAGAICPRYLKFSQHALRFARALAEGDAMMAQQIQHEGDDDDNDDSGHDHYYETDEEELQSESEDEGSYHDGHYY